MSTSTKKGKSNLSRRQAPGLTEPLAGLDQDELASSVAGESVDEQSVSQAGGEEPVARSAKKTTRGRSALKVEEVPEEEASAPAEVAALPEDNMAPKNIFVRFGYLIWFLVTSPFIYLKEIFLLAFRGLINFGRYALRSATMPSKFETGKNLFWLAVCGGLLYLLFTQWPPGSAILQQEITSVSSETQKIIVDERAVKQLRAEVSEQFKVVADEIGSLRKNLKASDDKSTQMFDLIQQLTKASDEMGKWVKAAESDADSRSGANKADLQQLREQTAAMSQQLAALGTLEARQNSTLESALIDLEKKLVALQDERDAKLRAEIKRVEQQYLTVVSTQDGKVQAVEPDEGKIREIAEAVLKNVAGKHWDSVTSSTLAAISEDNLKRLIRESLSADSQILKTLYENHIRSHVTSEATKTAAEVASHLIAEAANTITGNGGDSGTKQPEEPVETKPKEQPQQQHVAPDYVSFSKDDIVKLVSEQMEKYIVGGVAMPDFALRKAGASVVPHLTQSRHFPSNPEGSSFKKLLASIIPPAPRSGPEEALKPVLTASDCWPFYGGSANLTVELACPVKPTHITIDHIHHKLTPHSTSAPKSFKVFSLSAVNGPSPRKQLLGHYTYQKDTNQNVQTFPVMYPADSFVPFVTLEIEDNWGHWYTCLYRFRVHGEPSDTCKSKI
eukprot:TRINITY_DN4855_c0_g2_i1.p1 TRINITY_DN4855_c0_g2~~TRINITY_DN4855_c0_g2_i1.p1  ORF type:complete len:673 (+),score=210.06 TRINITY_DN4855_c0_g2_i1:162-2180(+)